MGENAMKNHRYTILKILMTSIISIATKNTTTTANLMSIIIR
jgi:hypothetical protein